MADVQGLRRLHEAGSGEQWIAADFHGVIAVRHGRGYVTPEATRNVRYTDADKLADARLIAAMHNDLPALLDELAELRGIVRKYADMGHHTAKQYIARRDGGVS